MDRKPICNYSRVEVFTSSSRDRAEMGDRLTEWIAQNPAYQIVDTVVTQSSDRERHCLTIIAFARLK